MSEESDFGNFLAGFVIGGLIGAAAALLYAPQPGVETRTQLRDKGIELKDRAQESYEETRVRLEKAYEDARMRAEDAMDEMRVRAEEYSQAAQERVSRVVESGKSAARSARQDIEEAQQSIEIPPSPAEGENA